MKLFSERSTSFMAMDPWHSCIESESEIQESGPCEREKGGGLWMQSLEINILRATTRCLELALTLGGGALYPSAYTRLCPGCHVGGAE
jgi:hypothetical protein